MCAREHACVHTHYVLLHYKLRTQHISLGYGALKHTPSIILFNMHLYFRKTTYPLKYSSMHALAVFCCWNALHLECENIMCRCFTSKTKIKHSNIKGTTDNIPFSKCMHIHMKIFQRGKVTVV